MRIKKKNMETKTSWNFFVYIISLKKFIWIFNRMGRSRLIVLRSDNFRPKGHVDCGKKKKIPGAENTFWFNYALK